MYYAINEKTGERTASFFEEDDLIVTLEGQYVPGDFWDVYGDGNEILYYFAP